METEENVQLGREHLLSTSDIVCDTSKFLPENVDEWPAPVIVVKQQRDEQKPAASQPPGDTPISGSVDVSTNVGKLGESQSTHVSPLIITRRDAASTERGNMLAILKLVIKQLIDLSLSNGGMIEDIHGPLLQFFTVIESMICHGLKTTPRKGLLWSSEAKDCWTLLERFEQHVPSSCDIMTSVKDMSSAKTSLGKLRAWLRMAMMQKSLVEYIRKLVDLKEQCLVGFYEPWSIMLSEEAHIISGLLVGLNVVDCNVVLKDSDDLDRPLDVIDYSLYLKEILVSQDSNSPDDEKQQENVVTAITNQKNYLEELNRHLTTTVANLNQKVDALQVSNVILRDELAASKINIEQLQIENSTLRADNNTLMDGHQRAMQLTQEDIKAERESYNQSRQGLDAVLVETKQKLREEVQMRMDVEKELELQIGMKQEMEIAIRLLEKDAHEKQDMIISLRKQLDEIKNINCDINGRLQTSESALQHKTDVVNRLEQKTNQMASTIREMEETVKQCQAEKIASTESVRKLGQQVADKEAKRLALETDLKIEREWRGTLQRNLEQEKAKVAKLQTEVEQLNEIKKEFDSLQSRYRQVQSLCEEQEKTLAELGSQLSQSKLKVEDLKEAQSIAKEAQWAEDREATHCRQCAKMFSVSRRRHHCRHCGEIFCNECSNIKVMLPSSSKPVRVCDSCNTMLLQRSAAN